MASRTTLKTYFKKGAIPKESDFADLIDSMIIQDEDSVFKSPNDPLSIKATGAEELLNFYRVEDGKNKLTWQMKQKPGDKVGLSINEGASADSRLFIESGTGNVGIGTTTPHARLDVMQAPRSGTHPTAVKGAYITGDFGAAADGVEIRHSNGTQGIGFGYNTIYATGSNTDQSLNIVPKGNGGVGIGTTAPTTVLHVVGTGLIGEGHNYANAHGNMAAGSLTIGSNTVNYGGGSNWNANTAGLLLETAANTEIAVHDSNTRLASLMYYEGDAVNRITIGRDMGWGTIGTLALNGSVGIGTAAPQGRLQIVGAPSFDSSTILYITNGATDHGRTNLVLTSRFNAGNDAWNFGTAARNSIVFSKNASPANAAVGGPGIDQFSIQLEGNSNSLGFLTKQLATIPALVIQQDGNVGIGTTAPKAKLTISGDLIRKVAIATGLGPEDETDNGQIVSRVLSFTKQYPDTAIRILYCDNLRVWDNNVAGVGTAARWEIRIDGNSVPGGAIYQDKYADRGNHHAPAMILGYATGIGAGAHTIGVWVSSISPYTNNAYTGWHNSRWTIEAQEVWTQ